MPQYSVTACTGTRAHAHAGDLYTQQLQAFQDANDLQKYVTVHRELISLLMLWFYLVFPRGMANGGSRTEADYLSSQAYHRNATLHA